MSRRSDRLVPSPTTVFLLGIAFALVGNMATNAVEPPDTWRWWPWAVWTAVGLLVAASAWAQYAPSRPPAGGVDAGVDQPKVANASGVDAVTASVYTSSSASQEPVIQELIRIMHSERLSIEDLERNSGVSKVSWHRWLKGFAWPDRESLAELGAHGLDVQRLLQLWDEDAAAPPRLGTR